MRFKLPHRKCCTLQRSLALWTTTPPLLLTAELLLPSWLLCPALLSLGCLCLVFETGIVEGLCGSSGMGGGQAMVCCQLFWWLQIASALVGWSRHQQAEKLSKELSQCSLIHAWCTTRWQNTATTYGGGGRQRRVEGTGGAASEENRRAIRPILRDFN